MMSRDKYILCNAVLLPSVSIMITLTMYVDKANDSTDCIVKQKLLGYVVHYTLKGSIKSELIKKMVVFV